MPSGIPYPIGPAPGVLLGEPLSSPIGGLLPSSLNVMTRDGAIVSRPGFQQLGQTLSPADETLGSGQVRDKTGVMQLLVCAASRLWTFSNVLRAWGDLSG